VAAVQRDGTAFRIERARSRQPDHLDRLSRRNDSHFGISVNPGGPLSRPGADVGGCCGDLNQISMFLVLLPLYMLALGLLSVGVVGSC
jgi:hypothetical protein